MNYNIQEISRVIDGQLHGDSITELVREVLIDSRIAHFSSNHIFVALKGERFDAHVFLEEVYLKGGRFFIVSELPIKLKDDAVYLLVKNTLDALQAFAAYHRSRFSGKVIAITGSNGKTIVKEWLCQILSSKWNVCKSPGSYNSQVGVALSLFSLSDDDDIGVFEAGISTVGEMEKLQKMINPDIGIFTNLGSAHEEGFVSPFEKFQEKWKLFKDSIVVFGNGKLFFWKEFNQDQSKCLFFAENENAVLQIINKKQLSNSTVFYLRFQDQDFEMALPFLDEASIENAFQCVICLLYLGWSPEDVQKGMSELRNEKGRLQLRKGKGDTMIVDDTYNNDLSGLKKALEFLPQTDQAKIVVLSEFLQVKNKANIYAELKELLLRFHVATLYGVGESFIEFQSFFNGSFRTSFFETTQDLLKSIRLSDFQDSLILVKGARKFQFERVVSYLEQKGHRTILEVDLQSLVHNLNYFKSLIRPSTKIMVMVKASAYGSGIVEVAHLLRHNKVDYLGVAYVDEGVVLREAAVDLPIMVMNPDLDDLERIVQFQLESEVYRLQNLIKINLYAQDRNIVLPIHLKLDTGMKRLGFAQEELSDLLIELPKLKNIDIKSVFTHLAATDDPNEDVFTQSQIDLYDQMYATIVAVVGYKPIQHVLNSGGIQRLASHQKEMVRLGVGLYGVSVFAEDNSVVENVFTLKTYVSQIKKVKAGETIGYNRKGVFDREAKIATVAIGYADGFDRRWSNGVGEMLVNGVLCPVVGNVCMDMTMIDVSCVDVQEGDEVVVFGNENKVSDLAQKIGTIPYEVLTDIGERIKRVFYSN